MNPAQYKAWAKIIATARAFLFNRNPIHAMSDTLLSESAWQPGITAGIPHAFRALETIFREECALSTMDDINELAQWTGLPHEELTAFRPERLALHELLVRVTADIAVPEGEEEEVFGHNFRRITWKIRDDYLVPDMETIRRKHAALEQEAHALTRQILAGTLFPPIVLPPKKPGFLAGLFRRKPLPPVSPPKSPHEIEFDAVTSFKTVGLAATDPLKRATYKSLYRVLGAMLAKRGRLGGDKDLLAKLVTRHVCSTYGSQCIGQIVSGHVQAAMQQEVFAHPPKQDKPILISLKGASASGKSSLRPMVKQLMSEQGMAPNGYVTISPDVWRRVLLDYESLGVARKYAGHLTSRELKVIDGKLDRYIRDKADREHGIPHMLVDRFRFDSFASEKVGRVLHNTYAKYIDTMYMYFIVTPPEETVERGWQRGLERGRYKAVEDFLGHCVEAYSGMPKLLFKWLNSPRPVFRYTFLDNLVPKGTFPKTIAVGDRHAMTIFDPVAFINIERYRRVDTNATTRETVYPPASPLDVHDNAGFLKECLRRIPHITFVDSAANTPYLRSDHGKYEILDHTALERMRDKPGVAETLAAIGVSQ